MTPSCSGASFCSSSTTLPTHASFSGNDDDFFVARYVDALDQLHQPHDVFGVVADDDDVRVRDRGDVAVLRNHRPQRFDEFVRIDVLRRDHARHEFFAGDLACASSSGLPLCLASVCCWMRTTPRRLDRRESMHAQHREEQLVDVVLVETRVRNDGDFAFHARVDDEGLAGDRGDLRDELVDVGVFEIDLPRLFLRDRRRSTQSNMTQREQRRAGVRMNDVIVAVSIVGFRYFNEAVTKNRRVPRCTSSRADP